MDCGDCFDCCCSSLPCLKSELQVIKQYCKDNNIKPQQAKGKKHCKYLNKLGKCSVYEKRPETCRVFGEISNKHMQCPKHPERVKRYDPDFDKYGRKVLGQAPVPTLDE